MCVQGTNKIDARRCIMCVFEIYKKKQKGRRGL